MAAAEAPLLGQDAVAAPGLPPLAPGHSLSTWVEGTTARAFLQFFNQTDRPLQLMWLSYTGEERVYATVPAGGCCAQSTYSTHPWRVRRLDGAVLGEVCAPSGSVDILGPGALTWRAEESPASWQDPAWGQYRQRGQAMGMAIMAYDCVSDEAVRVASHTIMRMLADTPHDIVRRMADAGACLAIIGRGQVTTDIPPHRFMKFSSERDIDGTTRGLGGNAACPTCSCGEENILMRGDTRYFNESILIHEFAHTVKDLGMSPKQQDAIAAAYQVARASGAYDTSAYIMENEDEYWAEGAQAFFDATVRTDVTSGITSREKLWKVDPGLARCLEAAFGCGSWRYPLDAQGRLCRQRPPNGDAPRNRNAWRPIEQAASLGQQPAQQQAQLLAQQQAQRLLQQQEPPPARRSPRLRLKAQASVPGGDRQGVKKVFAPARLGIFNCFKGSRSSPG